MSLLYVGGIEDSTFSVAAFHSVTKNMFKESKKLREVKK